ncbi:hypothetical protein Y887_17800 [Xanthomonas pisi DSM 18956]|uniref:Acyl carrier protein n=1 Tax=Xanthomonas pisi TaxID=56457 RepID=A0A2S7D5T5_9XANT|nr:hypothetical protein Y887_17800 [Xanthomonas pisi DSM 18956]PPU69182.1 hypothetical protein XpiCFBP4643_06545 [Xanthomonas pisi]
MDTNTRITRYVTDRIGSYVAGHDDIFKLGLVDSLFAMQLVLFVEHEFQLVVEGEELDLDNFCSIDAMSAYVHRKLGKDTHGSAP